jgi:hypothetical protein
MDIPYVNICIDHKMYYNMVIDLLFVRLVVS